MPVTRFRLVTLDVWGNARDGFEVNNWFRHGAPELRVHHKPGTIEDADVIRALRRAGHLKKGIKSTSIEVEDLWPDFGINDVRQPRISKTGDPPDYGHGKPVFLLENCDPDAE